MKAVILFLLMGLVFGGCSGSRPQQDGPADPAALKAEVEAFLKRYTEALADPSKTEAVAGLYVDDGRFAWYEDGQKRYSNPQVIAETLGGYSGMTISTDLSEIEILPLSQQRALVNAAFATRFSSAQGEAFAFQGVLTMLLEKQSRDWKVVSGHSSSVR